MVITIHTHWWNELTPKLSAASVFTACFIQDLCTHPTSHTGEFKFVHSHFTSSFYCFSWESCWAIYRPDSKHHKHTDTEVCWWPETNIVHTIMPLLSMTKRLLAITWYLPEYMTPVTLSWNADFKVFWNLASLLWLHCHPIWIMLPSKPLYVMHLEFSDPILKLHFQTPLSDPFLKLHSQTSILRPHS